MKDHPNDDLWVELPPRARRIQIRSPRRATIPGTTSACAENTYQNAAHPEDEEELPPRARRIPKPRCSNNAVQGTTSACAENTGAAR